MPFARFQLTREQELPAAFAAAGLSLGHVCEVVLTHHHGDHVDGLVHVRAPVRRKLSDDGRIVAVATGTPPATSLPSHDRDSAARLDGAVTVSVS